MKTENDILSLAWLAVRAAIPAGGKILEIYETDFEVDTKADHSPLTRADMESHKTITEILSPAALPILSEEGRSICFEERKRWDLFWLVDPLDGTKEFVKKNGEFTVNIALIEKGYPIAGIIYVPVTDVLYAGIQDKGSYRLDEAANLVEQFTNMEQLLQHGTPLPESDATEAFTVVCSRSHMSPETEAYIDELREQFGEINFASRGSSLKLCLVAEGKADVYPRFAPTMEWDTAAGQAVAECSGALVVDVENNDRLQYNKQNLLNPWFIVSR